MLPALNLHRAPSQQQQIADQLRSMLLDGTLPPGTKLPSTQALAVQWGTPVATVQAALTTLAQEGLLLRKPRVGTVVQARARRLTRVGVYVAEHDEHGVGARFSRALQAVLRRQLEGQGSETSFWIDPRPVVEQGRPWGQLQAAVEQRQVEGLIVLQADHQQLSWLRRLPLPLAYLGASPMRQRVDQDHGQFVAAGLGALAAQGCRRVGVITVLQPPELAPAHNQPISRRFFSQVAASVAELGLELRPEWLCRSPAYLPGEQEAEHHGYASVIELWRQRERPEGLLVFTDLVARGVVMGLFEVQARVPDEVRLALHRNAEIGLLCPFPATFVETRIADLAATLIEQVARLHAGAAATPAIVPFAVVSPPAPNG